MLHLRDDIVVQRRCARIVTPARPRPRAREGEFRTAYGVIEFTHCKLSWSRILPNLIARDDGLTPLASKQWAYRDLKAVGRNLDLVDMDELEDDDDWS